MQALTQDLTDTLGPSGFVPVADPASTIPDAILLLRRQTWNTNRAVVVVAPAALPPDFAAWLREIRKRTAYRCRFFPFFYGIGIQVVVIAPGLARSGIDPNSHVAAIDNQWAIIQSVFLVDPEARTFVAGRTWGQFVTGKYQDAIAAALARHFQPAQSAESH